MTHLSHCSFTPSLSNVFISDAEVSLLQKNTLNHWLDKISILVSFVSILCIVNLTFFLIKKNKHQPVSLQLQISFGERTLWEE